MNQSKFSLADVLTVLSALGFGFVCFLSRNFFTLGNTAQSILFAAFFAVLLGSLVFFAKLMKKTASNFKTCRILEYTSLFLFAVFAFLGISVFSHFFVVYDQKQEIQRKVMTGITQAEKMFVEYEKYAEKREKLYERRLQSVVAGKDVNPAEYANYGFENNGIADREQIEKKMQNIKFNLFPSNYTEMKQIDSTWLAKSKATIDSWKSIGVVGVVNEVEIYANKLKDELVSLSTKREKGEKADDFNFDLSFEYVKDKFQTLDNPTPLAIALAVGLYFLMLISYLVSERHSKNRPRGGDKYSIDY